MPHELIHSETRLAAKWPLPHAAAMGSAVRAEGVLRHLAKQVKPDLRDGFGTIVGGLALFVDRDLSEGFAEACLAIDAAMEGIERLPVAPREVEDILGIKSHERLKWTADGRLPSAGMRSFHFRGRKVTYHVHDPARVEDAMNRDLPSVWRREDKETAAANRRFAAGKAARTRTAAAKAGRLERIADATGLSGWHEFGMLGIVRD